MSKTTYNIMRGGKVMATVKAIDANAAREYAINELDIKEFDGELVTAIAGSAPKSSMRCSCYECRRGNESMCLRDA